MPLNPQVEAFLARANAKRTPPVSEMSIVELRQAMYAMRDLQGRPPTLASVSSQTIPTATGGIPIRVYRPAGDGLKPLLVFFHGGGWVRGDLDIYNVPCRRLADAIGCVVVSVDYRLAPEYPFPQGLADAWDATCWAAKHGEEFGGDTARLAVGGDSSGGNLAAVVARRARDAGGPTIGYQLLLYPVTDYAFDTPSYQEFAAGYLLTRPAMQTFWGLYLNHEDEGQSPDASPLRAADLTGLPPACVLTNEYDPLRDEGDRYAARLRQAGVAVHQKRLAGMIHPVMHLTGIVDAAQELYDEAGAALRAAFF